MPTISDELRQAGGVLHRQQAEASADASAPASAQVLIDSPPAVPTAAQPDEAASNQDPPSDQIASAGDFANMNMSELMQLDLVLNEDPQATPGKPSQTEDLTELSLLDLMNLKVTTEQAPELPDLNPPDHDFRLHDENPSETLFNRVSINENLAPTGTLPGTSPVPDKPPPPAPPPPPPGP